MTPEKVHFSFARASKKAAGPAKDPPLRSAEAGAYAPMLPGSTLKPGPMVELSEMRLT
jgi:hypothetical protein